MTTRTPVPNALARATAIEAGMAAGAIARRGFLEPRTIKAKGYNDIVTEIDEAAEETICALLSARFPADGILAEERGTTGGSSDYIWVIDPLDGTHNYAAQLPFWCVSIARYNQTTEQVELGVIVDPLHDDVFVAERGQGAALNAKPIHVAAITELQASMVGCDIGYVQELSRRMMHAAAQVQPEVRRVRILGSAVLAMAYVACGRLDAFFHLHLQPWDLAAAWLLIEEAGGKCNDWYNHPTRLSDREIVAGPPHLAEVLAEKLAPYHGVDE
ncbi:MAG TPA: inositol monophosphatase family protein [Chloroflexia bacterium]|nr:inositol monophosphatase family protein [Chloroflexia bacterium]